MIAKQITFLYIVEYNAPEIQRSKQEENILYPGDPLFPLAYAENTQLANGYCRQVYIGNIYLDYDMYYTIHC